MSKKTINKQTLAAELSEYMGWTKKKSLSFINEFIHVLIRYLSAKKRVVLTGFGVFETYQRKAHQVIHPITKQPTLIDPYIAPHFKPAKHFIEQLNNKKD